jgi:hypothetical protein
MSFLIFDLLVKEFPKIVKVKINTGIICCSSTRIFPNSGVNVNGASSEEKKECRKYPMLEGSQ